MLTKITELPAYKLGIIDQHGNKLRNPKSLLESVHYSPREQFLIKMRNLCGNKLDLLSVTNYICMESSELLNYDQLLEYAEVEFELKQSLMEKFSEINNIISSYENKLSKEKLSKIMFETMIGN